MSKRTRLFLFVATGILVVGLGTGLLASYVNVQSLVIIGADGPDELAYVPADAKVVAFANVREIMDSELRQKIVQFTGRDAKGSDSNEFQQQTGIDIERDIDQVIASVSGDEALPHEGPPLVLARGRFNDVLIEGAAREKGATAEDYKGKRLLSATNMAIAFLEPGLVAVGTPAAVRRAIDTKASGADVRSNDELMRLLRDSDDGNAWAVARFDALTAGGRLPKELATQLPSIRWFAVSGHVNGGVHGMVRAETRDEMAAQDLRQVLQGFVALARMQTQQQPAFADLLSSFQLGGSDKTVSLGFAIPSELIDTLGAMHALRQRTPPADPGASLPAPSEPVAPAVPAL